MAKRAIVLHLTDLHFGKETSRGFVIPVAQRRLKSLPGRLVRILSYGGPFSVIHVLVTGDLAEGSDNYETQCVHNTTPVIEEVYAASQALWNLAQELYRHFQLPVIFDWVPGNHGRVSKGTHKQTNWDNFVCQNFSQRVDDNKNHFPWLRSRLNLNEYQTVTILGHRGLINHKLVAHVGTPSPLARMRGWIMEYDVSWLASGHWHTPAVASVDGRLVFKGGSLCGPDDLSDQLAKYEPAAQTAWIVDEETGPGDFHIIRF